MGPHAPVTPTQNPVAATDKPSGRRSPIFETVLLCITSTAFVLYAGFIIGGVIYTGWDRVVAPQINHVVMTTLAVLEVTAVFLLVDSKRRIANRENVARQNDHFTINAARLSSIETQLSERRSWASEEPPTVPNVARGVYASVSLAAIQPNVDDLADAVLERLAPQVEEFGRREWWRGFGDCAKKGLDGVGADVLPLARNGRGHPPH